MNIVHFVAGNAACPPGPNCHMTEIPMIHYFDCMSYMNYVGSSVEEGGLEAEVVGVVFQRHSFVCSADLLEVHRKTSSVLLEDHVHPQTCG